MSWVFIKVLEFELELDFVSSLRLKHIMSKASLEGSNSNYYWVFEPFVMYKCMHLSWNSVSLYMFKWVLINEYNIYM